MTEQNAQALIFEKGSVWIISTSSWGGTDRLTPDDIGKAAEDIPDIFRLGNKSLLPNEWRVKLNKPRHLVTSLMRKLGKSFFIHGAWWIPNSNFMVVHGGIKEIEAKQGAIVEDLIENMPEIRAEMIEAYPVLADAEWPDANKVRKCFRIRAHVCEIKGAEVSEADPEGLAEAKRKFQADLAGAYEEYRDQILLEAQAAIIEACGTLAEKIMDADKSTKITEATLNRPRKIIEDYLNIAEIFDLDSVKAEVHKLQATLSGYDAKTVRDDWAQAQVLADAVKNAAINIGDLSSLSSDGTVKRVVKKAA